MAIEIERKFLVRGPHPIDPSAKRLVQGYIAREDGRSVRVRFDGVAYTLTIKGPSQGMSRTEFEWPLSDADGESLLMDLCSVRIEKIRHKVPDGSLVWEIDVFAGDNAGLLVAEIEVPNEATPVPAAPWLGPEVTSDPRFFNAALLDSPFCSWGISYAELLEPNISASASR
ncbi:MAG: CYTH domain-containing protein [Pseudomonadota bacterium]